VVDPGASHGTEALTAPISVLVVDDHLLVADSVAAVLTATAGICVAAVTGTCAEALEAVSRLHPDVVLLDQRLPDGLGTDLLPELLAASPTTKVVLVTAESSDATLFSAVERGCAGFVRKGARVAELVRTIQGVARNQNMIGSEDLLRLLPRLRGGHQVGDDLTPREATILQLLVNGASTDAIAEELVIALATARNHVQSVLTKLSAHSRVEAVSIALRERISTPPE
jgi:two-component system response regulator DevR